MERARTGADIMLASIFTVNLLAMFTRRYPVPDHSILFGPRGTGKTTWELVKASIPSGSAFYSRLFASIRGFQAHRTFPARKVSSE